MNQVPRIDDIVQLKGTKVRGMVKQITQSDGKFYYVIGFLSDDLEIVQRSEENVGTK